MMSKQQALIEARIQAFMASNDYTSELQVLQKSHEECVNALQVAAAKAQDKVQAELTNDLGKTNDDQPRSAGASSSKASQHKPSAQGATDKGTADGGPKKSELWWQ